MFVHVRNDKLAHVTGGLDQKAMFAITMLLTQMRSMRAGMANDSDQTRKMFDILKILFFDKAGKAEPAKETKSEEKKDEKKETT